MTRASIWQLTWVWDPKHADQMVRGAIVMPHGTGRTVRILVFAKGDKESEAREAGADHVGGDELAQKIQDGWFDFDRVIATPDMMGVVGRLGRVLGPRGLMPNPKLGTVTPDVGVRSASRSLARLSTASIRMELFSVRSGRSLSNWSICLATQRH